VNDFLLHLCSYHQPRRVRVIENVCQNHPTVANLFWAQQYSLINWLGCRRDLDRDEFNGELATLEKAGLVSVHDNQVQLTAAGVSYQEENPVYEPHFFDWFWLANTRRVEQRFLLGIQVVSEFAYRNRRYVPVHVPYSEQGAVKAWFHRYCSARLVQQVARELELLGTAFEGENEQLVTAFFAGLVGHDGSGQTIAQVSQELGLNIGETMVINHDALLGISAFAKNTTGPIARLLQPLLASSPLSTSCWQTINMLRHGIGLAAIAQRRRLKLGTIREHVLTAAILAPQVYQWEKLLPSQDKEYLRHKYEGPVASWQFVSWGGDENRDFFCFRLYQIIRGSEENG
jgi:uncharacterized protein YpbB